MYDENVVQLSNLTFQKIKPMKLGFKFNNFKRS